MCNITWHALESTLFDPHISIYIYVLCYEWVLCIKSSMLCICLPAGLWLPVCRCTPAFPCDDASSSLLVCVFSMWSQLHYTIYSFVQLHTNIYIVYVSMCWFIIHLSSLHLFWLISAWIVCIGAPVPGACCAHISGQSATNKQIMKSNKYAMNEKWGMRQFTHDDANDNNKPIWHEMNGSKTDMIKTILKIKKEPACTLYTCANVQRCLSYMLYWGLTLAETHIMYSRVASHIHSIVIRIATIKSNYWNCFELVAFAHKRHTTLTQAHFARFVSAAFGDRTPHFGRPTKNIVEWEKYKKKTANQREYETKICALCEYSLTVDVGFCVRQWGQWCRWAERSEWVLTSNYAMYEGDTKRGNTIVIPSAIWNDIAMKLWPTNPSRAAKNRPEKKPHENTTHTRENYIRSHATVTAAWFTSCPNAKLSRICRRLWATEKKEIVKGNDEDERITEQQQWNNAHNPTLHKAETYCSANHMAFGNKHYAALSVSVVGWISFTL